MALYEVYLKPKVEIEEFTAYLSNNQCSPVSIKFDQQSQRMLLAVHLRYKLDSNFLTNSPLVERVERFNEENWPAMAKTPSAFSRRRA